MAYDWFRVDSAMVDHPKVFWLAQELGEALAGWYVVRLWAWLQRYAPRGVVSPRTVPLTQLENIAGWRGEAGKLWSAMVHVGLVDQLENGDFEVHDWWEKQGPLIEKANKDADRKREMRSKLSNGTSVDSPRTVGGTARVDGRDVTIRSKYPPNPPERGAEEKAADHRRSRRPTKSDLDRSVGAHGTIPRPATCAYFDPAAPDARCLEPPLDEPTGGTLWLCVTHADLLESAFTKGLEAAP